ncbi:MAG: filamentous hemagglutinin N-terminal domain-containing protein, partial [Gammaproteobacteria bacterium]|nr:filamentous hemagglutinin N-terminal domain-containing protein [Gammaproteobacteria bacterium]
MQSLNHIYRTIWSDVLGTWIAVSEITRTKGKRSGACLLRALNIGGNSEETDDIHSHRFKPLVIALACCFAFNAQANPNGGVVVHGAAGFNTAGNTLTVTNTPGTIINWQGFSINAGEVTRFAQQSAASTVLNRVVTNNPSVILGSLQSNGQVYLVNANGILFGAGSTVDVAGLVATSLNLSDADFLAGRHNFTDAAGAQNISNAGNLNAQQGGQIYLIAPNVENTGIITAPNGEILLAAGHSVELVNSNDPNLRVQITAPAGDATNIGQLVVGSGNLGLFGAVVKNSGLASADSATMQGGKIVFKSSQRTEVSGTVSASGVGGGEIHILSDMQDGTVQVSGTLDASAPVSGNGGFVDTSAAHVRIEDGARISTLAANGKNGNWLIDPTDYYVSAVDPANGSSWMSNATLASSLVSGNVTIQTLATGAGNGDIFVNDVVSWNTANLLTLNAHRHVNINAAISNGMVGNGIGVLAVRADSNGTGTGTIIFGGGGSVALTAGAADFYYNPTVFGTPNNYVANVTGTLREWMLVNNDTNLQNINTNLAGNYALGRDIDAATVLNFVPLGNVTTNFTGRFDGLGHTISNLTITNPGVDAGLFGVIGAAGTVSNVGLVNSIVVASNSTVGGLAGLNAGTISNSYVSNGSVTVTGSFADVGGLVGSNSGTIIDSHVEGGSVHGEYSGVGGLAGSNTGSGIISESYVSGGSVVNSATWTASVGGLVGSNAGAISNSYVNGGSVASIVSGSTGGPVGGLVGYNTGSISTSYASNGSLTSTSLTLPGPIGGLVGRNFGGSISNSFWDTETTGIGVAAGFHTGPTMVNVAGLATASTISSGTVSGYLDTSTVWWMSDTNTRPFLRSEWSTTITNSHELQLMAMDQYANYTLVNNIDMTLSMAAGGMWSSAGFVPIGDLLGPPYGFAGKFDGLGNTITGLYINRPATSYVGLFGAFSTGGGVSNVNLVNANVTGLNYVGGLVGYSSSGNVSNSQVIGGSISGTSFVGALVGSAYNTVFDNDHASSNVSGTDNVGGLVGGVSIGTISNSYVDGGSLVGTSLVGGLVGSINGTGIISNSHYNINAVTINGANAVTFGGLYNDSTANFNGVGQFTDWLVNGSMSLNIANYTTASGGSLGTAGANSYTIGTAQGMKDLLGFADNAAYTFTLTGNITLPTGVYVPHLAADFDGAGFIISGLNLNQFYSANLGLFGNIAPGTTVSNVSLQNASVIGYSGVGALAGLNEGSISNSHSINGTVAGMGDVGGLIGHNQLGSIDGSYVTGGAVSGVSNIGGLVGLNAGDTSLGTVIAGFITSSYVDGGMIVAGSSSGSNVGGLVGQNAAGSIDLSYVSAGVVSGNVNVGGLVGLNGESMVPRVSVISNSSVDTGTTVDGFNYIGGLVGHDSGEGVIQGNTVTDTTVTGNSYIGGLAGAIEQASFTNTGYQIDNQVVNSFVTGGAVTGSISGIIGGYIGGLVGWNGNTVTSGSVIGTVVTGDNYVGGLIGYNASLTFSSLAGGIISGSFVSGGTVAGNNSVGGLIGGNQGDIGNSFVLGSAISGGSTSLASAVGGLVGSNNGGIVNTYASGGTVSGANNVGGLVGDNSISGTINFSYADVGSVTGLNMVGGVVGYNYTSGSVTNTFWNTALTSANLTFGIGYDFTLLAGTDAGAAGLTSVQMMNMANFTAAGWSIANTAGAGMTWRIYEGQTGPMLTSFLTQATVTANDATKTYDGVTYSGGNGTTTSVVAVNGGSVLGTFGGTSQGARNAGTYVIDATGLYSDQLGYDITGYTNGTLTINQATLTLNAVTDSRIYDGTTLSSGIVNVAGLFGSDTVTGASQSFGSSNVLGANGSTLAVDAGYVVNDGNGGANYTVVSNTATGTISAATLNIDAVTDSKVYDGTTASVGAVSVAGLVGGDTVTGASQSFGSRNVLGANGSTLAVDAGYVVNDGNG